MKIINKYLHFDIGMSVIFAAQSNDNISYLTGNGVWFTYGIVGLFILINLN